MKNTKIFYLLIFLAIFFFGACQDNPSFPDPGFDLSADKKIEIRRDTADSYDLRLDINAPNGIEKIVILNGITYEILEEFTEYRGETKLDFIYTIDFSSMSSDTTLNYIINVIDQDNRNFNKSFVIDLKGFSVPNIKMPNSGIIGVSAPAVTVKALITTGMNNIENIKVYFDGEQRLDIIPDTVTSSYGLFETLLIDIDFGEDHILRIDVQDDVNQITSKEVIVKKVELKKPVKIKLYKDNNYTGYMFFEYDGLDRVSGFIYDKVYYANTTTGVNIDTVRHNYSFNYNAQGVVDTVKVDYITKNQTYHYYYTYVYEYAADTKELMQIREYKETEYLDGSPSEYDEDVIADAFNYNADGTVKSFIAGSRTISGISYEEGFVDNEKLFAEYWYTNISSISEKNRQKKDLFAPVSIPTYFEELPPFVKIYNEKEVYDLFYYKYVSNRDTKVNDTSYDGNKYSYESNEDGDMIRYSRIQPSRYSWQPDEFYHYYFEY